MFRVSRRLLLLGSTVDARDIGAAIAADAALRSRIEVVSARARDSDLPTEIRRPPPASEHRGAFDGVEGMIEAMKWDRIDFVVDASHPVDIAAADVAANACDQIGVPILKIVRPPWTPVGGDRWTTVPSYEAAAHRLSFFARAFLATGKASLPAFRERRDLWFLARIHQPLAGRFPLPRGDYAMGRPPFSAAHERTVLSDYRINWVVMSNDGGPIGRPLLDAARERGAQVMMVERPSPPRSPVTVDSVDAALAWLRRAGS